MCFAIEIIKDNIWVNGEKAKAIRGEYSPGEIVEKDNIIYLVVEV
jgi:hypothetical protein